jgi:hypothetical protein
MLLSAVSVLAVAQSSSEIPEGLMNNPVLILRVFNRVPLNTSLCYSKVPFNTGFTVLGMSWSTSDQGYSIGPDVVGSEINTFVDLSCSVYGPVQLLHKHSNDLRLPKRDNFISTFTWLLVSKGLCSPGLVTINTLAHIRRFYGVQWVSNCIGCGGSGHILFNIVLPNWPAWNK